MDQDAAGLDADHHHIRGHEMRDEKGQVIGVVDDVIYDDVTGDPKFMVVHPKGWMHNLLHDDHYVPVHRTHWEGDAVVTPFDKEEVLHAPAARFHDHVVDPKIEHALEEHYHLAGSQTRQKMVDRLA